MPLQAAGTYLLWKRVQKDGATDLKLLNCAKEVLRKLDRNMSDRECLEDLAADRQFSAAMGKITNTEPVPTAADVLGIGFKPSASIRQILEEGFGIGGMRTVRFCLKGHVHFFHHDDRDDVVCPSCSPDGDPTVAADALSLQIVDPIRVLQLLAESVTFSIDSLRQLEVAR